MKDPFVIRTSTADYLYYSGLSVRDQTRQTWGVGMAVRSHERGAIWRRSPQPVVEPVENSSHPFPVVVRRTHGPPRRRWALFHAVRGRIVVSWSADGRTWRGSKTVLSSTSIPGGSVDIFTGDVRRIAGSWRLFFAYRPPGRKFTMAVASARRLGSRFVGVQRIRDPQRGDRFELASDAKAGDRRLRVQPRGATGGRVLAIVGTPAGWSVVHIRSIDRSGRATLDVPLAAALPAGSEGRPVTSASVSPRSLVTSTRDPLLLATAFQTIPGCLIEMSLLGRLRLDFQRGRHAVRWNWPASPLVPMGRPGSWNISSAENPVMVRRRG